MLTTTTTTTIETRISMTKMTTMMTQTMIKTFTMIAKTTTIRTFTIMTRTTKMTKTAIMTKTTFMTMTKTAITMKTMTTQAHLRKERRLIRKEKKRSLDLVHAIIVSDHKPSFQTIKTSKPFSSNLILHLMCSSIPLWSKREKITEKK